MQHERKVTLVSNERSQPAWERHVVSIDSDGQTTEHKDFVKFTFQRTTGGEPTDVCNCDRPTQMFYGASFRRECGQRGQHRTPVQTKSFWVQTQQELAEHGWREALGVHLDSRTEEVFWGDTKNIKIDTASAWKFAVLAQEFPLTFYVRKKPPSPLATAATQTESEPQPEPKPKRSRSCCLAF